MWIHYYLSAGIHYGFCFWGSSLFISSASLSANIFLNANYPPFLFSPIWHSSERLCHLFLPAEFFSLPFHWSVALKQSWLYERVSVSTSDFKWTQSFASFSLPTPTFCMYLFKDLLYYHRHIPWEQLPLDTILILVLPLVFPLHSYDVKYTFEGILLAFYSTCLSPL